MSISKWRWTPCPARDRAVRMSPRRAADRHPLCAGEKKAAVATAVTAADPLSAFADEESSPPTPTPSRANAPSVSGTERVEATWRNLSESAVESWGTTRGTICIPEGLAQLAERIRAEEPAECTRQARLALLEGRASVVSASAKMDLTPKQFSSFVDLANEHLAKLWKDDQRVQVIKLSIQFAKMLGEPKESLPEHYPCMFFQLVDLISYFGQLIYDRLVAKCPGLKVNFVPEDVDQFTQELCKNWLMKIVSVRELVPRIYLETAFLKCYRFLKLPPEEGLISSIDRLTLAIRGIANPLAAAYARVYLVYKTHQVLWSTSLGDSARIGRRNYEEFVRLYNNHFTEGASGIRPHTKRYLRLFSPAIVWLIQGQLFTLDSFQIARLLNQSINEVDSASHPGILYKHLIEASPPSLITDQANHLAYLASACVKDERYPVSEVIHTLGMALLKCSAYSEKQQQGIAALSTIWKAISSLESIEDYTRCAPKELDRLLGDIASRVADFEGQQQVSKCVASLLKSTVEEGEVVEIFTLSNYLPLFDVLQSEDKTSLALLILERVIDVPESKIKDPALVPKLMYLCETVANAISVISTKDESRVISHLTCHVISAADFGVDFDKNLRFLTDCRGKFIALDLVQIHLVSAVNGLAARARVVTESRRPRRGFFNACFAYAYITIPSIVDLFSRLQLSLDSAQIALHCRCIGQAEDLVRGAVNMTSEVNNKTKRSEEQRLVSFFSALFSLLLVFPGDVEESATHLVLIREALAAVEKIDWRQRDNKAVVLIRALKILSVATWEQYPYHIAALDSNDVLFKSSNFFLSEVNDLASEVLGRILQEIHMDEENNALFELLECIVCYGNLNENASLATLALKLWKAGKGGDIFIKKVNMLLPGLDIEDRESNLAILVSKIKELR